MVDPDHPLFLFEVNTRVIFPLLLAGLLAGCSFIPKNVELGQDKVKKFPAPTEQYTEALRDAAYVAHTKTLEAQEAASVVGVPEVIGPLRDATRLTGSVSMSLGPPLTLPPDSPTAVDLLEKKLAFETARLDREIRRFATSNDENAGKKIEGTGWLQIPYFVWVGGALMLFMVGIFVAQTALKVMALTNPAAALGSTVLNGGLQMGGRAAGRMVGELFKGGEFFKDVIKKKATWTSDEIVEAFRVSHERAQDGDTRKLMRELPKPKL